MRKSKTLKELTIKDNFMFGAVMSDEENCRRLLEMVLEVEIEHVVVSKEKTFTYHPQYKGIRLDVYAKDKNNTCYNVEMQATSEKSLGRRARYYQSQMDTDLLLTGRNYSELSESYVIFICDFDPFGKNKYSYSFINKCEEDVDVELEDGRKILFLSTEGQNEEDVPKTLVKFLEFVKADLNDSMKDFEDEFIARLQCSIRNIKSSREMEDRFMKLQEMLQAEYTEGKAEGRAEGRAEGITEGKAEDVLELLSDIGNIPEDLKMLVMEERNLETLNKWLRLAAKSDSIEQFVEKM